MFAISPMLSTVSYNWEETPNSKLLPEELKVWAPYLGPQILRLQLE